MQKTLSVINLYALRENAKIVRSLIGGRFFYAVVKADAYGHGAEKTAQALSDIVDGYCVAIADEGAALRISGIDKPVLVLSPPLDKEDARKMAFYSLTPTVACVRSASLVSGMPCHIAINTGMNRYGCYGEELEEILRILPKGSAEGAFTHFYAAQSAKHCKKQYELFLRAQERIRLHSPLAFFHMSASGGILRGGKYLLDGVRCGLMLYGYAPNGFRLKGLKPALKVYARLCQSTAPIGDGVGYNVAKEQYSRLYTYRLGYADGFARGVPLGEMTLCMDAFISTRKRDLLPVMTNAQTYAARCNTIPYEVLCSVTRRSERIYIHK